MKKKFLGSQAPPPMGYPSPIYSRRLRRLYPCAFGARLGPLQTQILHPALVVFTYRQPQSQSGVELWVSSSEDAAVNADELISRLNEQLHEKDMKLTDVRLEALSSAHQLEQLREMLSRMKVSKARETHARNLYKKTCASFLRQMLKQVRASLNLNVE